MPFSFVREEGEESNDAYLASIPLDDPWRELILAAHARLLALDPEYSIVQIKEKFGTLRYYFHSRLYEDIPEVRDAMATVVRDAEVASAQR